MNDNSLVPIKINLNIAHEEEISESYLRAQAFRIKWLIKSMFGEHDAPFAGIGTSITGTPAQLAAFANVIGNEGRYMDAFNRNGLGDPHTFQSKWRLDDAVGRFERETGLKWPFK